MNFNKNKYSIILEKVHNIFIVESDECNKYI